MLTGSSGRFYAIILLFGAFFCRCFVLKPLPQILGSILESGDLAGVDHATVAIIGAGGDDLEQIAIADAWGFLSGQLVGVRAVDANDGGDVAPLALGIGQRPDILGQGVECRSTKVEGAIGPALHTLCAGLADGIGFRCDQKIISFRCDQLGVAQVCGEGIVSGSPGVGEFWG